MYARELDKHCNWLEKRWKDELEGEKKKVEKEVEKKMRGRQKTAMQKARRKGQKAAKEDAAKEMGGKVAELRGRVKELKKVQVKAPAGGRQKEDATRPSMVEMANGRPRPDKEWKKRSAALRKAGIAIHGDAEGYNCDLLSQVTATPPKIDALLNLPVVASRCAEVGRDFYVACVMSFCYRITIISDFLPCDIGPYS